MRKINVILTMEVADSSTLEEIYQQFRNEDLKDAYESGDLSVFTFVDADTELAHEEAE